MESELHSRASELPTAPEHRTVATAQPEGGSIQSRSPSPTRSPPTAGRAPAEACSQETSPKFCTRWRHSRRCNETFATSRQRSAAPAIDSGLRAIWQAHRVAGALPPIPPLATRSEPAPTPVIQHSLQHSPPVLTSTITCLMRRSWNRRPCLQTRGTTYRC